MNILDIYEVRGLENKSKEELIELVKTMKEEFDGIYINTYKRLTQCEVGDVLILPDEDDWVYVTKIVEYKKIVVKRFGMKHSNEGKVKTITIPWGVAMVITDVRNIY